MDKENDNVVNLNKFKKEQQQQKQPQPKQLTRQDVMEADDVQCQRCGGELYLSAIRMKRISKLLIGSDKDQIHSVPAVVCANCGLEFGAQQSPKKEEIEEE